MKTIFLFLFSFSLLAKPPVYEFKRIQSLDSREELLEEVQRIGKKGLEEKFGQAWKNTLEAYEKSSLENTNTGGFLNKNRVFKRSLSIMKKAKLMWNMDVKSWRMCGKQTMAYVVNLPNMRHKVFICPIAYIQDVDLLTQIFIHEAAHMGGVTGECQASKMEMIVVGFSRLPSAIQSGYWDKCGLDRFLDIIQ